MHEIKAYKCDFCKKHYLHKGSAKRHEDRCFKNPKLKACLSCEYFKKAYRTITDDVVTPFNYCDFDNKLFIKMGYEEDDRYKNFKSNCKHWRVKEGL